MRHKAAHYLSARPAPVGIVDGLIETVFSISPFPAQAFQIADSVLRRRAHHKERGIRRHHLLSQAAAQAQFGHAKGLILVIKIPVKGIVSGFRNAKRQFFGETFLGRRHALGRFPKKRPRIGRHQKSRHEIFKHRPAPADERPECAQIDERPRHGKPMPGGNIALGNGDKAGLPDL